MKKCLLFTKFIIKIETGFLPCPGTIIIICSLIVFGSSEKRVVSIDAILCMLRGYSTEAYYVSISSVLLLISVLSEMIF